jgi:hypothetical protein
MAALAVGGDRIDLSWKPVGEGEEGPILYHIYWDMGTGFGLYTYKTSVEETRYTDLGLRPGTTYRYRVVADSGEGQLPVGEVLVMTRPMLTTAPAATSGTPTPAPRPSSLASRTARATPNPTALPADTVLLGLMGYADYVDDLDFIHIVGEVRNDAHVNVTGALITITFYDGRGEVIEETSAPTLIDILKPKQRSPFITSLPRPPDMWEYSLRAIGQPTLEQPWEGLTVIDHRAYEDEAGFYHVVGEVENSGRRTADFVQVVVALYDKWGKIVNVGFVYSQPSTVRPGERAAFDCSFTYYPRVQDYTIQVERD